MKAPLVRQYYWRVRVCRDVLVIVVGHCFIFDLLFANNISQFCIREYNYSFDEMEFPLQGTGFQRLAGERQPYTLVMGTC